MTKLTQAMVDEYLTTDSISVCKTIENVIIKRIDEVLRFIFGKKLECWYFHDAPEGSVGELDKHCLKKSYWIDFCSSFKGGYPKGVLGYYAESVPYDFLFMSNEDILKSIKEDEEEEEKKKMLVKKKEDEKKLKTNEKIKKALDKLSKDDIKILGLAKTAKEVGQ